jgi:hypothetical protein
LHNPFRPNISFVVDNALHYSAVIANVEESEVLAVLAAACNPATHGDSAANVFGSKAATQMSSK